MLETIMFWKRHRNQQDVCLLSETNRVSDERLDAGTIHAESPDTAEAWGLDSKQQCKDEKTNRYIQFISSLSCDSIQIYHDSGHPNLVKTDTAVLASQTEDQEMTYTTERGRQKDSRLLWIGICLAMLTLTVCILVLLKVQGS